MCNHLTIETEYISSKFQSKVEKLEDVGYLAILFPDSIWTTAAKFINESVLAQFSMNLETFKNYIDFKYDLGLISEDENIVKLVNIAMIKENKMSCHELRYLHSQTCSKTKFLETNTIKTYGLDDEEVKELENQYFIQEFDDQDVQMHQY